MSPECAHALDAGAYLLSALPPEDHDAFAEHLLTCGSCRREVEQLQVVVDTLPIAAPQLAPPPELRDRIMRIVDAEAELLRAAGPEADRVPAPAARQRRRWASGLFLRPVAAGALASVLLAVGVAGGVLVSGGDGGSTPTRNLATVVAAPGARVIVAVKGSQAALHVTNLPAAPFSRVYQVWIKRGNRIEATHTLFNVRKSDGSAVVPIEESVAGADQILVTDEPDGGSQRPTSAPLITASLS
ncbi:MAG: hypothetical protein JWM31_3583 [Solirubrobacterales bacterium]|nr:hypothetical protein [Solirubrobacterales bacterium]